MFRRHFNASTIIAIVALVFAMTGGAYAAKHYLITSTKQISPKVLKSLAGKAGPAGANGAQGPAGPAGPAGKEGGIGKEGPVGKEGKEGPAGKEGKTGATGQTGFTATLPEGATETGVISYFFPAAGGQFLPISFNIPLEAPLAGGKVHAVSAAEVTGHTAPTACKGTLAAPTAEAGSLCVYLGSSTSVSVIGVDNPATGLPGTATSGAYVVLVASETAFEAGTWAVTG